MKNKISEICVIVYSNTLYVKQNMKNIFTVQKLSRRKVFCKTGVPRNYTKFAEHLFHRTPLVVASDC